MSTDPIDISDLFRVEEGDGFGLGGFGGIDEPFGSVGTDGSVSPISIDRPTLPTPSRGAVLLAGDNLGVESSMFVDTGSGIVNVGRGSTIDTRRVIHTKAASSDDTRLRMTGCVVGSSGEDQGATIVVGQRETKLRYPLP